MKVRDESEYSYDKEQSEEEKVGPEERKRRAKIDMNARLARERTAAAKGQPQAPGKFPKGRQQADEVISSDSESVYSYYEESGEEEEAVHA